LNNFSRETICENWPKIKTKMDEIEKAVFVENPRGYLKALDGNKKRTHFYVMNYCYPI